MITSSRYAQITSANNEYPEYCIQVRTHKDGEIFHNLQNLSDQGIEDLDQIIQWQQERFVLRPQWDRSQEHPQVVIFMNLLIEMVIENKL